MRLTYLQHPDVTPESKLAALAAVYAFVLEAHAQKNATKQSDQDDTPGDKVPPLQVVAREKMA